eukprot:NODE_26482_length_549_cov_2.255924.p6 GENE.NODE_26482_length_549_cov_2.255924~~NODE_26482_length_549_cov_2.255924.p6  ORF type:complete len:51 (-),score=7.83 NODE_26482_length_549_cov_2.255924:24-176(-)
METPGTVWTPWKAWTPRMPQMPWMRQEPCLLLAFATGVGANRGLPVGRKP